MRARPVWRVVWLVLAGSMISPALAGTDEDAPPDEDAPYTPGEVPDPSEGDPEIEPDPPSPYGASDETPSPLLTPAPPPAPSPPQPPPPQPVAAETAPVRAVRRPGGVGKDLEQDQRIDSVVRDVESLRASLEGEPEPFRARWGLAPPASKVYRHRPGLSVGGYGIFGMSHALAETEQGSRTVDPSAFVLYLGYRFDERVLFNAGLSIERATTARNPADPPGGAGEVSLPFSYVELRLSHWVGFRGGLLPVPMGISSERYDPVNELSTLRPAAERWILPTPWRELGIGLTGRTRGLNYRLYLLNGLAAAGFDRTGVRGGRQSGNRAVWEDKAIVGRVEYDQREVQVGGSFYFGGADQDPSGTLDVTNTMLEGHVVLRWKGARFRGLYAQSDLGGAESIGALRGDVIPALQWGWFAELSYNLLRLARTEQGLLPFFRFEDLNLQAEVPVAATADRRLDSRHYTGGLNYQPHPQVAIKAEYSHVTGGSGESDSALRFGAGFVF